MVHISPDSQLTFIPFGILGKQADQNLSSRYVVNFVSSGRELVARNVQVKPDKEVAVFADPHFGSFLDLGALRGDTNAGASGFSRLEGTRREANAIADTLASVRLFLDYDASVSAIRQVSRPTILHIATHGVFNPSNAQQDVILDTLMLEDRPIECRQPDALFRPCFVERGRSKRRSICFDRA